MTDAKLMAQALEQALIAHRKGECPVGAVLVHRGEIIARAGNRELELRDPTAHAEILVLRAAGRLLGRHRLSDCTVYTTLAPCPMCENAMLQASIPRVVFGSRSFQWVRRVRFAEHNLEWVGPVMEPECRGPFVQWAKEVGRSEILDPRDLE